MNEMNVRTGRPDAAEMRRKQIVKWHAQAYDLLDTYGVPRFDGSFELRLAERIKRLYLGHDPDQQQGEASG